MPGFAIHPRRYHDQLDAIEDVLETQIVVKKRLVDPGRNPQGKLELLLWAAAEIRRLRVKCNEPEINRRSKLIVGPRPKAESAPVEVIKTQP